jgi:hypothetical protein
MRPEWQQFVVLMDNGPAVQLWLVIRRIWQYRHSSAIITAGLRLPSWLPVFQAFDCDLFAHGVEPQKTKANF